MKTGLLFLSLLSSVYRNQPEGSAAAGGGAAAPAGNDGGQAAAAGAAGATLATAGGQAAPAAGADGQAAAPAAGQDGKPAGEQKPAAAVVPEAYTFDLGPDVPVDNAAVERFTPVAKDLGLSNEQANKLAKFSLEENKRAVQTWNDTITGWAKDAQADPEIGGNKWDQNLGVAREAVRQFSTPAFSKMLDDYGIGNHPEMIRFLYRVGSQVGEAKAGGGNTQAGTQKSAAEVLYGGS